jgi:diguanylate cyclase (GGDEF)-like protein
MNSHTHPADLTTPLPILLLVDDQPLKLHFLNQIFQDEYQIFTANSGKEALALCQVQQPDLVIMDIIMTEMDGYEVCRSLKRNTLTLNIPVIFVTAFNDAEEEEKGFAAGAVDFIARSARPNVIRARVKTHITLKHHSDLLRSLSLMDGLTGIANRRHFDQAFMAEWRRCIRWKQPLALIMIDIDFFKQFNDYYGHQAGDACLIQVAKSLKAGLNRSHDLTARYGGEEFVCLLPETALEGAQEKAQSLLKSILKLAIPHERSSLAGGVVSISLGVAVATPTQHDDPLTIIQCADRLMYTAKKSGRNQVQSMQL